METITSEKPKSIRIIGLIVLIIASMTTFSNSMCALVLSFVGGPGIVIRLAGSVALLSVGFLFGGIFLRQYKLWASRLLTVFSILLIITTWYFALSAGTVIAAQEQAGFVVVIFAFLALIGSVPPALLIGFLNRSKIRQHFS